MNIQYGGLSIHIDGCETETGAAIISVNLTVDNGALFVRMKRECPMIEMRAVV
jgi:hypothetical protein